MRCVSVILYTTERNYSKAETRCYPNPNLNLKLNWVVADIVHVLLGSKQNAEISF